jgi:hypothetical protein
MCLTLWKRLLIRQNVLGSFATSLKEETLEDGSTRTVLKLPSVVAHKGSSFTIGEKRRVAGNSS